MIVKGRNLINVELFQLGVSNEDKNISFNVPKLNFGGISAGQAHIAGRKHEPTERSKYYNFDRDEVIDCKVVSLDHFNFISMTKLSFIKIDIEGAEFYALRGMEKLIAKFLPVILIEVQPYFLKGFNIDSSEFKAFIIQTLGYSIYFLNESSGKLEALDKE